MKRVVIRTLPRTMSGRRGGCLLTVDARMAEDWIDRRWADPVETPVERQKPARRPTRNTA